MHIKVAPLAKFTLALRADIDSCGVSWVRVLHAKVSRHSVIVAKGLGALWACGRIPLLFPLLLGILYEVRNCLSHCL